MACMGLFRSALQFVGADMPILLLIMDSTIGNWHCSGRLAAVFLIFIVTQVHSADEEKRASTLYIVFYKRYSVIYCSTNKPAF